MTKTKLIFHIHACFSFSCNTYPPLHTYNIKIKNNEWWCALSLKTYLLIFKNGAGID